MRALIATALVTLAFFTTPVNDRYAGFEADGYQYGAMAGAKTLDPVEAHQAPWCYRVVTPFLASSLPFETMTNFRILAFVSNVVSLLLIYEILGILQIPPISRMLGVLLYAGSFWTLKFSFYSPAYIDYQTQLFLLLIVYLTLRQSYFILLLILPIAAMQKESLALYAVFSVIHCLKYNATRTLWSRLALTLAILIVPLLAVLAVRSTVVAQNVYSPLVFLKHFRDSLQFSLWPVFLQAMFSGLGMIPVVMLIDCRAWLRFLRTHQEWIAFGMISIASLFGGCDKSRLLLYLLPLAVVLACRTASAFERLISQRRFAVWTSVVVAFQLYTGWYLSPLGKFPEYMARMVPEHSDGRFTPYLIRNASLALILFAFSVNFLLGETISPGEAK